MTDWRARGACVGKPPHWWFPPETGAGRPRNDGTTHADDIAARAIAICADCPVLLDCRTWAIAHEREGIWGGLTELQRERQRRRQGIRLHPPEDVVETTARDRAIRLWNQGWNVRAIAEELRTNERNVHRWLTAAGIDAVPPPDGSPPRRRREERMTA